MPNDAQKDDSVGTPCPDCGQIMPLEYHKLNCPRRPRAQPRRSELDDWTYPPTSWRTDT